MILVRGIVLAIITGIIIVALTQTAASPPNRPESVASTSQSVAAAAPPREPPTLAPEPTPRPTRVPLPTQPPQMIISRIARETPLPRPTTAVSGPPRVSIVDNGFLPNQMTVSVGATVQWVNTGSGGHDVTGNGP